MIITYLPDRTGKEAGTLAYYDIDPALLDTATLQAKNWNLSYEPIMVKYIFDSNVYENFLPITPSYPQSNYEVIDDVKADGRVVRTLKYRTDKRPTRIVFGDSSSAFAESGILSLLDVLYVDIKENISSMNNIFAKAENVTRINTRNWDTSNVIDLYCAFYFCASLKHLEVGHFKTKNVTDMTFTFYNNKVLESVDVTNWNTSKVTAMYGLFAGSPLFKELDLSNWDFSKATNVNALFMGCEALETLNISNCNINPNLTIAYMFGGADKLSLVNVNNCSADVINLLLSLAPNRTNKDSIKFYALHNTKEHASLDKTTADARNLKVVIRGGNIKTIHLPDELFQSLGLGNNLRVKHVHIGERFL
jgi:surface protein